jgi:hypothetical protein
LFLLDYQKMAAAEVDENERLTFVDATAVSLLIADHQAARRFLEACLAGDDLGEWSDAIEKWKASTKKARKDDRGA